MLQCKEAHPIKTFVHKVYNVILLNDSKMKILATARMAGSAAALVSPIKELQRRGHEVTVYATGSEQEARAFQDISYVFSEQFNVKNYAVILTGLHGVNGPDGHTIRAANTAGIPVISVLDQNSNYQLRLGDSIINLPTYLSVMSSDCLSAMRRELPSEIVEEAVKRSRVVGWTAFDSYAQLRESFDERKRTELLCSLELNPDKEFYFHATQNIHPDAPYLKSVARSRDENQRIFEYEMNVTKVVFEAASDLGLLLAVKPHPGEEYEQNSTRELARKHSFIYLPAKSCDTKQLMLSVSSVTAGRSTCLAEACLLDRNTGGILPDDFGKAWLKASPPVTTSAIPYTTEWENVWMLLAAITSRDDRVQEKLARDRKHFSVDGKASKRLADLVEEIGNG